MNQTFYQRIKYIAKPGGAFFYPVFITGIAAALRFIKLGQWSFWGDEAFTISGHEDGFNFAFWRRSLSSDLIQWVTVRLGMSEWNARLIPAVIGVLSVTILYFLLSRVLGKWTAMIASLLLAISPWHLYWSQNARFYTLLLLFYTIALLAFYQGLEKNRAGWFIVSLVFLALATRERLFALFFLPVAFLYVILLVVLPFKKPPGLRWRNLAIFFGPVILGAAIFVWPFASHFDQWMVNFGPANNQPIWILAGVVYYTGAPLVCLATFGGIHQLIKRQRSGLYFLLGAFIPLLAMMAISLVHYSANRYVFTSLTSWVILGGMSASLLFEAIKKPDRFLAFGVLSVLVVSSLTDVGMYFLYQNGNRENWKGALIYIQQNNQPGEQVIMDEPQVGQIYLGVEPLGFQDFSYPQLDQPKQSLWFIEDAGAQSQFAPQLEWIHDNARLERIFDVTIQGRLYPMRVYHYIPEP